jgi:hypothetical protein
VVRVILRLNKIFLVILTLLGDDITLIALELQQWKQQQK